MNPACVPFLRMHAFHSWQVQMIVPVRVIAAAAGLVVGAFGVAATAQNAVEAPHEHDTVRHYEGPPVSLGSLLDEALRTNPTLVALRSQVEVKRPRPAQERSLNPPTIEATIWQWPINTLNPAKTNMYMFMVGQE